MNSYRCTTLVCLVMFALLGSGVAASASEFLPLFPGLPVVKQAEVDYRVHVAYIIPSDRQPVKNYQILADRLMTWVRDFYAGEMERNGFGRRTFRLEADEDGHVVVHLIRSPLTAKVFSDTTLGGPTRNTYLEHAWDAVREAGLGLDQPGQVWLCIAEAHSQNPDGSVPNGIAISSGAPSHGTAVVCGMNLLAADPALIHDHRSYDGLTLPLYGPYPLALHRSIGAGEGDEVSAIISCHVGAVAHELGHAFTLQHCLMNDEIHNGPLMGVGYRGFRGALLPELFPNEDARLDRAGALALSVSPFFRPPHSMPVSSAAPEVVIQTPPGDMTLEHGALRLKFSARQPNGPGIAAALLRCDQGGGNVNVAAYRQFNGSPHEVEGTVETAAIPRDRECPWILRVYDVSGNFSEQTVRLRAPNAGYTPTPFLRVGHTTVRVGEPMHFQAGRTEPRDCVYHWDFGDGSTSDLASVDRWYAAPGVYEVRLSAADSAGRTSHTSQWILVRPFDPRRAKQFGVAAAGRLLGELTVEAPADGVFLIRLFHSPEPGAAGLTLARDGKTLIAHSASTANVSEVVAELHRGENVFQLAASTAGTVSLDGYQVEPMWRMPHAMEAEDLHVIALTPGAPAAHAGELQSNHGAGRTLVFQPTQVGQGFTLDFVAPPCPYVLAVRASMGPNAGVIQAFADGDPMGEPVDLYSPAVTVSERPLPLGTVPRRSDGFAHRVEIRVVGKNPASHGLDAELDYFRWDPDMTGPQCAAGVRAFVLASRGCDYEAQPLGPAYSGGHQLFTRTCDLNGWVDIAIEVPRAGNYRISARFTRAPDYGIVQALLDGRPIGTPQDNFDGGVTLSPETLLTSVALGQGRHVLRFKSVGKNERSAGVLFGVDHVTVQ